MTYPFSNILARPRSTQLVMVVLMIATAASAQTANRPPKLDWSQWPSLTLNGLSTVSTSEEINLSDYSDSAPNTLELYDVGGKRLMVCTVMDPKKYTVKDCRLTDGISIDKVMSRWWMSSMEMSRMNEARVQECYERQKKLMETLQRIFSSYKVKRKP